MIEAFGGKLQVAERSDLKPGGTGQLITPWLEPDVEAEGVSWIPSWNASLGNEDTLLIGMSHLVDNGEKWTEPVFMYEMQGPIKKRYLRFSLSDEARLQATACRIHCIATSGVTIHSVGATWIPAPPYRPEMPDGDSKPGIAWGHELNVEGLSQMEDKEDPLMFPSWKSDTDNPGVGPRLCIPTCLAMMYSYHGFDQTVLDVAERTYDHTRGLYGVNALSASVTPDVIPGGEGFLVRLDSLKELERMVNGRRPITVSIAWREGQLDNASLPASTGHGVVVAGFTEDGDVIVRDPRPEKLSQVKRVFKRGQFWRAWQQEASGLVYAIYPEGLTRPNTCKPASS